MEPGTYQSEIARNVKRRYRLRFSGFFKSICRISLIILFLNGAWFVISNLTTHPTIAKWGTIEKGAWVEALCLRDETVVLAPCDGFFKLEAIPGSRLPFGEVIGGISSGESLPESWDQGLIKSKLQVEAEKLYDHQYQLRLQLELLNAKNETLESLLRSVPTQSTLAQKTHKELIALKKEKERILRNIQQYQLSISNLQARFDLIQGPKAVLTAIVPGYFFNQFDNQEGRLTPGAYKNLTPNDLRRHYPLQSGAVKVKAGAVIGKIVSPFQQRLAIEVDPELTRESGW